MLGLWQHDLESLEAISQDADTKRIFLRMATLSQLGRLGDFLAQLEDDQELDAATKDTLVDLASNRLFLLAVEDYLQRTERIH